ncbi:MAG: DUF4266 domain-containing protein [Elusimicrobia bacterium]|nr:DUF4266 domain-containing protein [Candidatus Liberimonas magnetica]
MKILTKSGFILLAGIIFLALFFSGCSSVSPWQKGLLADPAMQFITENEGNTYEQHMLSSREASSGGYGGAGGGCGCK